MSFGTSILEGFRKGFGRGLGGQNPWFSHFFRCFFDIIFQARFGRRKNRPKMRKNQTFPLFGGGFAVYGTCLGRDYREGKHENLMRHLQQGVRWWCLVFDVGVEAYWSSTPCTTFGGRRIEGPQGGTPPPLNFGKAFEEGQRPNRKEP